MFQQDIGGTDACMKRVMKATKGCGQLSSNDTFFADSYNRRVKTLEEANAEGVDYCRPVKTSNKRICIAT